MIMPMDQWCIEIDVTNKCCHRCSNCTHLTKHGPRWEMTEYQFVEAVDCLADFPGYVGVIGGEPQMHSRWNELVQHLHRHRPRRRCALFTSLSVGERVREAFGYISVNANKDKCWHQPVLVARRDLGLPPVPEDCWLQREWSSSITPRGFFFCEVAGAIAGLIGIDGLPVTPTCWKQCSGVYYQQAKCLCQYCGIACNLRSRRASDTLDDVSDTWLHLGHSELHLDPMRLIDHRPMNHRYLSAWRRLRIWARRVGYAVWKARNSGRTK